jgi:hypothetical protein
VGVHLDESYVEELFRARYLEMVRLAGLLGAGDPEDIAQEAFTRLLNKEPDLGDARAWRVCAASSARACSSSSRSVRPSSAEAISAAPSFRALGLDAGGSGSIRGSGLAGGNWPGCDSSPKGSGRPGELFLPDTGFLDGTEAGSYSGRKRERFRAGGGC